MPGVVFVKVHEPPVARELLDAAYTMATEITSDPAEWAHVFDKAVDLLSARTMLVQQDQPLDLNGLRLPR